MTRRYVLAPEAALDLVQIWRYIKGQSSVEIADHVESVIRDRIAFLAENPGAGHWRQNLTDEAGKFFPVCHDLLVYRPRTQPLQNLFLLPRRLAADQRLTERLHERR